ncbi:hypothetical protein HU200_030673 [Digitaria exilis]|uniref:Jacalin-type lectin domain-containing protein n=1 Tax=Digitaria exilis TaxID=1010633 RepID=A0A835BNM0_9POAL|nr:hypothetical protein HU200_030673 [Digitaria exilis]
MAKLKLSGAAVLLIVVVPVFMYAGALLIGIQLGRALERRHDSVTVSFSIRGALAYVAKGTELWDSNNVFGRRRGRDERVARRVWLPFPASPVRDESPDNQDQYSNQQQHAYIPLKWAQGQDDSSSRATTAPRTPPQAQRFHTNHRYVDADGRVHVDTEDVHFVMEKPRRGTRYAHPKHPDSSPSSADDDMALEIKVTTNKTKRYHISNDTSPRGLISVGPWGGSGGQAFYMHGSIAPRLRSIVLQHSMSGGIHSMACDYYYYYDDGIRTAACPPGEHLTAVEGTTGHVSNVAGAVVTSLAFRTSTGRTYGRTAGTGTAFSVPAADGACIVGFWGRSGWLLDAIGLYIKPCGSSSSNTTRRARVRNIIRDE